MTVYIVTGFNETLGRRTILHVFSRADVADEFIKEVNRADYFEKEWRDLIAEIWAVD